MNPRKRALAAIDAVKLPPDWGPLTPHRDWERWTHRWTPGTGPGQNISATGQLHLQALVGHNAGSILVNGNGIAVRCGANEVQQAVNHVIAWIDHSERPSTSL